jgi:hypothetical protein
MVGMTEGPDAAWKDVQNIRRDHCRCVVDEKPVKERRHGMA